MRLGVIHTLNAITSGPGFVEEHSAEGAPGSKAYLLHSEDQLSTFGQVSLSDS